uniref:Uncharacterized protein n=1 Tax=uncultured marine virus TaxID=186617 RepID=A0A0F7L878_9VIRU|nr:hypothetical protein [uncultured marine virus]
MTVAGLVDGLAGCAVSVPTLEPVGRGGRVAVVKLGAQADDGVAHVVVSVVVVCLYIRTSRNTIAPRCAFFSRGHRNPLAQALR